jgi:nitroimidazol reductase NimA-like FMN-containing flavoprotein (pyridoxamine 5'-phosphate oxidase superfamily)
MTTRISIESESSSESSKYISDFLNDHYTGVLATADKAANPHIAVVYYTLDDDFGLLFATKAETQKYKNIEENEQVAFLVYDESPQTVVQVFGKVERITEAEQQKKVYKNMLRSSVESAQTELPPAEKLFAGEFVALRLVPQTIKMAVYARPDSEGDDLYETILFNNQ